MDLEREILRLQRTAALRPGLTTLQARLLDDEAGTFAQGLAEKLDAVAGELSDAGIGPLERAGRAHVTALHEAVVAAAHTLRSHWSVLHGQTLPSASNRREVPTAVDPEGATGADAFVEVLADCAVLAAMAADFARGETILRGVREVAPDRRSHEVPYALALDLNGESHRAESMLTDLMRSGREQACAAGAFGFLLQLRGDDRWRQFFDRARRARPDAELQRFLDFWTCVGNDTLH